MVTNSGWSDYVFRPVSVGDMQARLLAKIEELTLPMIQQDKEIRELRERVAHLENCAAGR